MAIDKSFEKMAQFIRQNGMLANPQPRTANPRRDHVGGSTLCNRGNHSINSNSETTIYDKAIQPVSHEANQKDSQTQPNRVSTSSEEINTSDELIENIDNDFQSLNVISDRRVNRRDDPCYDRPPQPGTSGAGRRDCERHDRCEFEKRREKEAKEKVASRTR